MNVWIAIGITVVGCYAVKLAGLLSDPFQLLSEV